MKRIAYIPLLIVLYLLCSARSCDDSSKTREEQEQAQAAVSRDSLVHAFAVDTLSAEQLRVYEADALQRFRDLCDYLAVVRDTAAAMPFRDKAQAMALRLLSPGTGPESFPSGIRPDSAWITTPLHRLDNAHYAGQLAYLPGPGAATRGTADFLLTRQEKVFGSDTIVVWEVRVGKGSTRYEERRTK